MVLICRNCGYGFENDKSLLQCPDCGKMAVHAADESEKVIFYHDKESLKFDQDEK